MHYIGAPRPRAAIVALIGEDNQSAPVLVLGHGRVVSDAGVQTRTHNGVRFIDAPDQIRRYLWRSTAWRTPAEGPPGRRLG